MNEYPKYSVVVIDDFKGALEFKFNNESKSLAEAKYKECCGRATADNTIQLWRIDGNLSSVIEQEFKPAKKEKDIGDDIEDFFNNTEL